jgi:mRNA interferase RelE/StbE
LKFSDQVIAELRGLHPGVRKDIRRALDDVDAGKSRDVGALTGELSGFFRLRIGRYRVVCRYNRKGELIAEYLGVRDTVYRSFKAR